MVKITEHRGKSSTGPLIGPLCAMCELPLQEHGALLLGPPNTNPAVSLFKAEKVKRTHLCPRCYELIVLLIEKAEPQAHVEQW